MTFRSYAIVTIILASVALGFYWYVNRPTPEERVLKNFFGEFKNSDYTEAESYTDENDFYEMAAETTVTDTDSTEYKIRKYFPETRKALLRIAVETYVKRHISHWEYLYIDTQRISENESVVPFRLSIKVKDYTSGNLLGEGHSGRVEGKAYMVKNNTEWKVSRFDLHLFSDDGMVLGKYLSDVY